MSLLQFIHLHRREDLGLRVNVRIDIVDAQSGELRRHHRGHNIVTDVGLAAIAAALAGASGAITHFGLGSGTTAAAAGQTALVSEIARPVITNVESDGAVTTAQYYLGSSSLNGSTLREAGLFVGSTMIARYVYNDPDLQPKDNTVAAVFTWTLTFARA